MYKIIKRLLIILSYVKPKSIVHLIPKSKVFINNGNSNLTKYDNFNIYKTDINNYKDNKDYYDLLFDVEEDKKISIKIHKKRDLQCVLIPWYLKRIVTHDLPLPRDFIYRGNNSCHKNNLNIETYILDTGIDVNHKEFEGRAFWLANFADNIDNDCHSHGTHCAGLVGSKSYGVCKDAKLFAVKVLDCNGEGTYSSILSGLNYIYDRHNNNKDKNVKSIINMSFGGSFSNVINEAVTTLLKSDSIYISTSAGNDSGDSCNKSPASTSGILTVMASDINDNKASFSNYGKCASLYAPGVNILSTLPNNNVGIYSGTSMASPIVVGVMNHYIDQYPNLNLSELINKMKNEASKDMIKNNPLNTNNLIVYLHRT